MSLQIAIVKQATLFGEAFETGAVTQARSTKKGQPWGATMGVGQLIFCKRVLNSPLCGSEVFDSTFTFESGENPTPSRSPKVCHCLSCRLGASWLSPFLPHRPLQ